MVNCMKNRRDIWLFFIEHWIISREGGGHGITGVRLKKVKTTILNDDKFWDDIFQHTENYDSMGLIKSVDHDSFTIMLDKFWEMIRRTIKRKK